DKALYGQSTYAILDKLKVTAGVRYTWDYTSANFGQINYAVFPSPIPGPPAFSFCSSTLPGVTLATGCRQSYDQSSSAPTGVFDIDYNPIQNMLVYAKYSRGYRQGGVATFVADGYHTY